MWSFRVSRALARTMAGASAATANQKKPVY